MRNHVIDVPAPVLDSLPAEILSDEPATPEPPGGDTPAADPGHDVLRRMMDEADRRVEAQRRAEADKQAAEAARRTAEAERQARQKKAEESVTVRFNRD